MKIEEVGPSDEKDEVKRIDYTALAGKYNLLDKGKRLKMDKVSNISHLKRALSRRGIEENKDFQAYSKGNHSFILKLTNTDMIFKR